MGKAAGISYAPWPIVLNGVVGPLSLFNRSTQSRRAMLLVYYSYKCVWGDLTSLLFVLSRLVPWAVSFLLRLVFSVSRGFSDPRRSSVLADLLRGLLSGLAGRVLSCFLLVFLDDLSLLSRVFEAVASVLAFEGMIIFLAKLS